MSNWSPETLSTPDTSTLEEIFDLGDEGDREVLRELYEQLLEDGPERIGDMIAAMNAGDLDEVDRVSHRLKSSLGNLGFVEASNLCNEIMQKARTGQEAEARELCGCFEAAGEALIQGIVEFLGTL